MNPSEHRTRLRTAYHEAGHAVIGLAGQLPITYACCLLEPQKRVSHVGMEYRSTQIGPGYRLVGDRYKATVRHEAAKLDAFGNAPKEVEHTTAEHHAEVVMCIAGPMAEARFRGGDWRPLASNSGIAIARTHRKNLGEAARGWAEYEAEASALIDKFWPMIGAVADRLMKVDFIGAYEIDCICCRVARQQNLKGGSQ